MAIKFGPGGLGPVKDAIKNLEEYSRLGLKACEIEFTYSVYIKEKEDAEMIGKRAKELGIRLSIHAPYFVNLNSTEPEKVENSKKRILRCLEVGTWLGATVVVFHPGFYGEFSKEETYNKIRDEILDLQKTRIEKKYTPKLAPETTGKVNVFGSIEEISQLVRDTKCSFTIDFAHILAREKDYNFKRVIKNFGEYNSWHVHFSGIEYGEKGERKHIPTEKAEFMKLFSGLPKNKEIVIINEAPDPVGDSVKGLKYHGVS
jgi:deoxyribonuclease-4